MIIYSIIITDDGAILQLLLQGPDLELLLRDRFLLVAVDAVDALEAL